VIVPTKVFIVDDDAAVCRLFSQMLTRFGYATVAEMDGRKAMQRLQSEEFDIVLLDLRMPEVDSITLLSRIKQEFPELPVIIVTGHGSIENAVESMRAGAIDFVTKPVEMSELDIRIKRALEHMHTRRLATTDGLTGLSNYRTFDERLAQEVDRANRYNRPLSLIMLDIDHFKRFNDTYGHPKGDQALVGMAHALRKLSRASDIVARYGGEEFALILPETDREKAIALGERLRAYVEQNQLADHDSRSAPPLTISVGIANHTPPHTKEDLLEAADMALYRAKRAGRNRIAIGECEPTEPTS
jgi:diguanylate cyclase (GGDEF)-like protein